MTIAFVGTSAVASSGGTTALSVARPSLSANGNLIVVALGFEGVAAGSGPWVLPNMSASPADHVGPGTGWEQVCYQPPSATGNGLEVWAAIEGELPSTNPEIFDFSAPVAVVAVSSEWSGIYAPNGVIADGAVRDSVTDQVTGNNPACPSIYAFVGELVVAVGADQLVSPGFGTPTPAGWTKRVEGPRGGSFANVSGVIADKLVSTEGATGSIPFSATASAGTTKGATATLAIRPASMPIVRPVSAELKFRFKPA